MPEALAQQQQDAVALVVVVVPVLPASVKLAALVMALAQAAVAVQTLVPVRRVCLVVLVDQAELVQLARRAALRATPESLGQMALAAAAAM